MNAAGGGTSPETEETCGSVWPVSEVWPFCTIWNELTTVFPHYLIKKTQNQNQQKLGVFSQKIICPGYSSIILSSAVEVASYWSSVVSHCLVWMKSPLAISLNEIPVRRLVSIVQSYSRYLLESWQFLLFRVRVALHSMGMSDCSLLGINCIKIKCKLCFFSVGKLSCSDPMKSCRQCEYIVAFKYDIQTSIHICSIRTV